MSKPNHLAAVVSLDDAAAGKKAREGDDKKAAGNGQDVGDGSGLFQGLAAKVPPVPGTISEEGRKHWYYIGQRLAAANLICEVDLGQFRILCETWANYVEAQQQCEHDGEFQATPNGYVQLAPWAVARERHANRYQRIADKFFLSPRARKSIQIQNPGQGALDLT